MTLPNALSLLRVFLVTPFLIAVIYRSYLLAFVLFIVAGLSDWLDGYLARRLGQKSPLGAFLDPIGDKLLIAVAFVTLAVQGHLPAWLAVIVVAKDIYTVLGAGILHFLGHVIDVLPSFWGKMSTFLQIATIGVVLLATRVAWSEGLLQVLFVLTGCVATIACLQYILGGFRGVASDRRFVDH